MRCKSLRVLAKTFSRSEWGFAFRRGPVGVGPVGVGGESAAPLRTDPQRRQSNLRKQPTRRTRGPQEFRHVVDPVLPARRRRGQEADRAEEVRDPG